MAKIELKSRSVNRYQSRISNVKFSSESEVFLNTHPSLILRGPVYVIFIILVAAVIYSAFTFIDVKTSTYVEIKGEEFIIQSPVSGLVNNIYIQDNDVLKNGDRVLSIYSDAAYSKQNELKRIEKERLSLVSSLYDLFGYKNLIDDFIFKIDSEYKILEIKIPEVSTNSEIIENYRSEFGFSKNEISEEFNLKFANFTQREIALVNEIKRVDKLKNIYHKTESENKALLDKKIISKQEYLDSKQKVDDSENQIESIAREFRITVNSEYEYILNSVKDISDNYAINSKELETVRTILSGVEIIGNSFQISNRFPGIITDLYVKTGQMIMEGSPIIRLIRNDYPLLGVINIPPYNIGNLKTGQKVVIKFDAFPFQIYGVQTGEIISISEDVKPVEGMGYAYEVKVSLKKTPKIPLRPGLGGVAEIITDRKRLIEIALEPVSKIIAFFKGE
ncbi:MAG: HlyD family efflux transporter periplasmic adaptor subunit [Candidatus Delongbacteria bacterium]|nr:HlyD family efflux transporter periplasmic adaptor subunit [Candidatus Delongbacteria bacterium]MBN2835535.1 HlyD family efflux transporter periplasmic adaptor subunit [Candidatus Delongbacteria bacterium]